jgi:hypothetical protein
MNHHVIPQRTFGRPVQFNGTDLGVARRVKRRDTIQRHRFYHRGWMRDISKAGIALLILFLPLAPLIAQPQIRVGQFCPSTNGLHFLNAFDHVPYFTIPVGLVNVGIGDAANGMCGGMGFTVRDYYESGLPVPTDSTTPSSGPLFDYLAKRLFDSFDLPSGPARYMVLMDPLLSDASRAGVMIRDEWPLIRADIDSGVLSPLGLIRVKTADPTKLGQNHQVLAYGYTLIGNDLRIYVYDPNYPDEDDVCVALNISNPGAPTAVTYLINGKPSQRLSEAMWCYFRTGYMYDTPPPGAIHVGPLTGCSLPDGAAACQLFGGPYRTVQEGVQAASPGDIVMIYSAPYHGAITITKALTLRARGGPATLGLP